MRQAILGLCLKLAEQPVVLRSKDMVLAQPSMQSRTVDTGRLRGLGDSVTRQ
jgi:hypothetical protein